MNSLVNLLERIPEPNKPFLIDGERSLNYSDIENQETSNLSQIEQGSVVAIIGDFDAVSIANLLTLIKRDCIVVPLTNEAVKANPDAITDAPCEWVVERDEIKKLIPTKQNEMIESLKSQGVGGLVLFSTGSTGKPKAILHNIENFLKRFSTPRPANVTLGFLLFDHIGGLNTFFHTMFNSGLMVRTFKRDVESVFALCVKHKIEVLPTTPTFLRLALMSGLIPQNFPKSLKVVTYGTEKMDQNTLSRLSALLPNVDFRQTYGMSELGILRIKSKSSDSLFMKIGGEGVELKIKDNELYIRSENRMLGYLNSISPFDADGWYPTGDYVEYEDDYYKIIGRTNGVINVGGLKLMPSEVEEVILEYPGVQFAQVFGVPNPITGQHVEAIIEAKKEIELDLDSLRTFMRDRLPSYMNPVRIRVQDVSINMRFKRELR
jgi:acyl-CoA synthetase (AMP-forming)/AMP-acid ligase II